ncbi:charged multivesicular body protein 7-like isoform X1 [Scylla paramamosain]|uniref:charged multivesicular body protein 7-like isoform X1 n=1 Tax=Scylla paramamosain TaxID=85552 RepID=UPI003083C9E3
MEDSEMRSYLPGEWGDPERMQVLMGPLPHRELNHVAHTARVTFWSAAIHSWCRAALRPFFTLAECQGAFRRGSQIPVCLPQVLQLMMRQGEIVPMNQLNFTDHKQETWVGWGCRVLVVQPAHMLWGNVKYFVGLNTLGNTVLVCQAVLQEMCGRVVETVWNKRSSDTLLITLKDLHSLVREAVGTLENLELVVKTLVAQGRAATVLHHGTLYVKFASPGDAARPEVLPEELAKSDLREARERVERSLKALEEEREALRCQAKIALSRGAKTEALFLLRRKKRVDKSVVTQLGVLENLVSWQHHLDDVETNRQVLGALKGGVEALRTALAGDTSPDAAATTLDDLQQVLEECEDLNALVSSNPVAEDLTGLEDELEGLLLAAGEETRMTGEAELEPRLPDVPTEPPLPTSTVPAQRLSL